MAKISIFHYDESEVNENNDVTLDECVAILEGSVVIKENPPVTWINVEGAQDKDLISKIGSKYDLHPIVIEHLLEHDQKPKIEDYGQYTFIVLKSLIYDCDTKAIKTKQICLLLGINYVISLQEEGIGEDVFASVKKRIRAGGTRLRQSGADYLTYRLMDSIVDHYFAIMEIIGEQIEEAEEEAISSPDRDTLRFMQKVRKGMIYLRKSIWPVREVLNSMQRGESQLIKADTRNYLRDLYDHTVQIIDSIETFRDMMSSLMEIYLSSISNRLNEIMKVLTLISTIFIPLTFLVGVYGMNFKHMPELEWKYGYYSVWGVSSFIVICMIIYFRRKKWF